MFISSIAEKHKHHLSKHHSHINTAKEILSIYHGQEPLSSFLKKYFSSAKKYGSKDRKQISHLCYCYFRLGRALENASVEERILTSLFLCSGESNEILAEVKPDWNSQVHLSIGEKLLIINYSLLITDIFPWMNELSDGIDHEKFCESFFVQPDLFIRVRPGQERSVTKKLNDAEIGFQRISDNCLALPNTSKIDSVLELDKEAVIQDYNSQQTGRSLKYAFASLHNDTPAVWDCCAASGGKSIMAYDINPNIELTVSDVRESILVNLRKRFQKAGVRNYKSFVADLVSDKSKISNLKSEIVICDAPCTGSGTWSRTPEQLYFFDETEIDEFSMLQKKIVSNVIPQLQRGGCLIYITCSVFKKENEDVVEFIKQDFDLHVMEMQVLKGYDQRADSMFVAVLSLPER